MTDSLLVKAGLLSPDVAGKARVLDYLEEEQRRGITIKTANISLLHEVKDLPFLINLVDTPGHVDFTGKVTRALRAVDGVIVLVDAVEEVMVQTEIVTRQALQEWVKPVLFINKVDRLIRELKLDLKSIQKKIIRIIKDFNNLIEIYGEREQREGWKVNISNGTVCLGSALHRWGFTVEVAKERDIKFSDIVEAYAEGRLEVLQRSLPLHEVILDIVVNHLPDPAEAQKYRVPKIWRGGLDSEVGQAMLRCDDRGPTVICLTMAQVDPHEGIVATGRIFSGTVRTGDQVYLVGARRNYGIRGVSIYMGAFRESVEEINAGNIAALLGLEQARAGETLVGNKHKSGIAPFEKIRYFSEPVVTMSVEPKHPGDLPKLIDVMRSLVIEDPNLTMRVDEETGEYLISGAGGLHLEIACRFIEERGLNIVTSQPIVIYRESVSRKGVVFMSKSLNRHNSFWIQVEPLEKKVIQMIEEGKITDDVGRRNVANLLRGGAGWSSDESGNVWAVDEHRNVLIDMTRGIQYLDDSREAIISGFRWTCRAGPLCEEPIRGIKVRLIDAQLHEDPIHRDPAQVMPAVRKAILGSFLTAKPILLEPVYKISVSVASEWVGAVTNLLTRKRGRIVSSSQRGPVTNISGYIPVSETFNLSTEMRSATSGHAFWQNTFDHWEKIPEEISSKTIVKIRRRKGLFPDVPQLNRFINEA